MSEKLLALEFQEFKGLITQCSTELWQLTQDKPIARFIHPSLEHELAAFAITKAMPKGTKYSLYYRCHAWALALGCPGEQLVDGIVACGRGKEGALGSMHFMSHPSVIDCNSVVGAQIPIAIGAAIIAKQQSSSVVCVLGDGATNCGAFFEGLNVARLLDLPLIFVVEDNRTAINTAYDLTSRTEPRDKFAAMQIPVVQMSNVSVEDALAHVKHALRTVDSGPLAFIFESLKPPAHMLSGIKDTAELERTES